MSVSGPGGFRHAGGVDPGAFGAAAGAEAEAAARAEGPAAAAPSSPLGTYTLAGTDPVRGPFRGEVTIAAGSRPEAVRVTYHAVFQDGKEGTVTGDGTVRNGRLDMEAPLSAGTGVFARSAVPGAPRDARFRLAYRLDTRNGTGAGETYIAGLPGIPARTAEGIARPQPGVVMLPSAAGPAPFPVPMTIGDAVRAADDLVSSVSAGVAVPMRAFDVPVPGKPDLHVTSPEGNTVRAFVSFDDGQNPRVSLQFDRPLVVKGPWYQPDVEISSIWLAGDKAMTDAHFANEVLDRVPGVNALPDRFASEAVAREAAAFEPLMRLLSVRAEPGKLPDAEAIASALRDAAGGPAIGATPLDGKLDLARASANAVIGIQRAFEVPVGTAIARVREGTQVSAALPLDLAAGRPGAIDITFAPPIAVRDPTRPLENLALPEVRSVRIGTDGRVTIGGHTWLGDELLRPELSKEEARAAAVLAALYQSVPAESELGKALRRAGVGPR